jgi:ATP-binding cassette, sub-family E, member 1
MSGLYYVTLMEEVHESTHRVAVLDEDLCKPKKCGLECIVYCPVNKTGGECIVQRPEDGKAVISEDLCTGCGICVKKCPFEAIVIVNLAKELGSEKIHQYGINSFRLYHLPTPKKGAVVGLLGRNGMGKSTIINILSGNIKPNLGNYNTQSGWQDVLDSFNGTEMKSYFEKISSGALKVAIKPQLVYLVPKTFKGTARELLEKYDERHEIDLLVNDLGLLRSLDKRLSQLSGGELQRLAVAVACSKEADYYFFDEPSSYNDIYQRLTVARVIKRIAERGKSVIVVEHDLTLLDYLSDYIHILYGEAGAYGIVSPLQSTKVGINNFLDGYIPSENIRFRDKSFKFDGSRQQEDILVEKQTAQYSVLTKSFSSYVLRAGEAQIREGEIVGIVGANALGKTTLMRMIAGAEKPDTGRIELQAKISYKPQYLVQDYAGDTRSLLCAAYGADIDGSPVENHILIPMGMKRLYDKNVSTLSGGELQKAAICSTLIRPAEIYAFDEPSAFLDVEDRIFFARFLHRFVKDEGKSAIIIDHDMQLIDLLSDSLIIFTGTPGINGVASSFMNKEEGINIFLKAISITYRRDETTGRPRINKEGSRLDKKQKNSGDYYFSKS